MTRESEGSLFYLQITICCILVFNKWGDKRKKLAPLSGDTLVSLQASSAPGNREPWTANAVSTLMRDSRFERAFGTARIASVQLGASCAPRQVAESPATLTRLRDRDGRRAAGADKRGVRNTDRDRVGERKREREREKESERGSQR